MLLPAASKILVLHRSLAILLLLPLSSYSPFPYSALTEHKPGVQLLMVPDTVGGHRRDTITSLPRRLGFFSPILLPAFLDQMLCISALDNTIGMDARSRQTTIYCWSSVNRPQRVTLVIKQKTETHWCHLQRFQVLLLTLGQSDCCRTVLLDDAFPSEVAVWSGHAGEEKGRVLPDCTLLCGPDTCGSDRRTAIVWCLKAAWALA